MSKVFSMVFGGGGSSSSSQQSSNSHSWNNAYPAINKALSPVLDTVGQGTSMIQRFLGGDTRDFDGYKSATGYDFTRGQGENNIMTNLRSQGLGNSGAALKALSTYNNNLQQTTAGSFIDKLLSLIGVGNQSANVLASAGQESTSASQGTSKSSSYQFNGLPGTK